MSVLVVEALPGGAVLGQTIHVDAAAGHATNTIVPTQALGAGVDRLPYGASDKLLTQENLDKVLSAGWQTVTGLQYQWHAAPSGGHADPDGPAARSTTNANAATKFTLPAASVTILRGKLAK